MYHIPNTILLLFLTLIINSCSTFRNTSRTTYESKQDKFLPLMLDVELDKSTNTAKNSLINNGINAKGLDVYIDVQNANHVDIELTSIQINVEKSQIKMPLNQILPAGKSVRLRYFINTSQTPSLYKVYVQVLGKNILSEQLSVGVFQNELPPFPADEHFDHHD